MGWFLYRGEKRIRILNFPVFRRAHEISLPSRFLSWVGSCTGEKRESHRPDTCGVCEGKKVGVDLTFTLRLLEYQSLEFVVNCIFFSHVSSTC